jgi:hypothetical protein
MGGTSQRWVMQVKDGWHRSKMGYAGKRWMAQVKDGLHRLNMGGTGQRWWCRSKMGGAGRAVHGPAARLGLKAPALAWLEVALALSNLRPSQSRRSRLGSSVRKSGPVRSFALEALRPRPRPVFGN